mgnify:CR=1 FL=1
MADVETTNWDYVIVGGGSAGSALANRLSADPATKVLVLEAGRPDSKWDVFIPVSYTHLRAHETVLDLVCRLLLEKKKTNNRVQPSTVIIAHSSDNDWSARLL